MTLDKRRILNAARHASIYQPALMKSKTLDYLEIFILQSCCRLQELYDNLSKFIVDQPLSEEDLQMYMAVQQDLAQAQADITTLTLVKEHLSRVTGNFEKAKNWISFSEKYFLEDSTPEYKELQNIKLLYELQKYQEYSDYNYIIYEVLKSYNDLFLKGKLNSDKKNLGKLSLINEAFEYCYLNQPETEKKSQKPKTEDKLKKETKPASTKSVKEGKTSKTKVGTKKDKK